MKKQTTSIAIASIFLFTTFFATIVTAEYTGDNEIGNSAKQFTCQHMNEIDLDSGGIK